MAAIADRHRIWKIVVDVAVKQFEPVARKWQSDRLTLLRLLGEVGDDDHVLTTGGLPRSSNIRLMCANRQPS
jgi:hypothetical protein